MKKLLFFFLLLHSVFSCEADSWTRKADFPASTRCGPFGFSIGNKGYVGGWNFTISVNDFWVFDPIANTWTQKASFPGGGGKGIVYATSFSIGNKGYVCTGQNYYYTGATEYEDFFNELWEYDPDADTWTQKANFPGVSRLEPVSFVIDSIAYVGAGAGDISTGFSFLSDFYAYNPKNNSWRPIASLPLPGGSGASSFSILSRGYILGLDTDGAIINTFWQYNPLADSWFPKASFPDTARCEAVAFTINNIGYFGTGDNGGFFNDLWEYCDRSDSWTQKSSIPSTNREETAYFTIGNKGYVCLGCSPATKETWEYTPDSLTDCEETTDCNSVSLPDTLKACDKGSVTFPALLTNSCPLLNFLWAPSIGLNDPTTLNPLLSAGTLSGWYYLTTESILPINLVQNENFNFGYLGFSSDYSFAFSGASSLQYGGRYSIATNPAFADSGASASFGDHTTGTGNMLVINGGFAPANVWCENIVIMPHANYVFSAWFANWSADTINSFPKLQFEVNDTLIGSPYNLTSSSGLWTQYSITWNSNNNTHISICINDLQTDSAGNDFAIDDIAFQQIISITDSMYVDRECPLPTHDIVPHDVITPNGDGVNDTWIVEGIQSYPKNTVQIFDKWGDKLYERTNYDNDWDGRGKHGLLPDGTYYYIIKLNASNLMGNQNIFTGSILIKR